MSTYEFPMRPVPAVGAIVFRGSQVLLVRRRDPPSQGRWSIPGGAVEVGETVEQAVVRETREETAVRCGRGKWSRWQISSKRRGREFGGNTCLWTFWASKSGASPLLGAVRMTG